MLHTSCSVPVFIDARTLRRIKVISTDKFVTQPDEDSGIHNKTIMHPSFIFLQIVTHFKEMLTA